LEIGRDEESTFDDKLHREHPPAEKDAAKTNGRWLLSCAPNHEEGMGNAAVN
jgi:hypothetical protein